MSTAPATESATVQLYRLAGLTPPRFVLVESPAGAVLAEWLLSGEGSMEPGWDVIGPELRDPVWEGLGDRLVRTGPRRALPKPAPMTHLYYRPSLPQEVRGHYGRLSVYGADRALADLGSRRTLVSPPRGGAG